MFVMLLILPESSSVVISQGLVAVVKARDWLAVLQDIILNLQDNETRVKQYSEMTCSFRVL